jgi:hypothetical protein
LRHIYLKHHRRTNVKSPGAFIKRSQISVVLLPGAGVDGNELVQRMHEPAGGRLMGGHAL